MLPTLVVGRRVHRPNPDPIRRPVTGGAGRGGRRASGPAGGPAPGGGVRRVRGGRRGRAGSGRRARAPPIAIGAGRGERRASRAAGSPQPGDGARRDRIGDGGGVRRVRGAAGPDEDGAGPCGNGADGDLVIRTGSGVSPGETGPFSPGTAIPGPGSARWRGRAGAGWCGWGSWGGPGRGRVQICHKGAPGRDRSGEEARNINDSPPVLRCDPGLCNRFGQTTPPRAREGRRGPDGDRGGRPDRPGGPAGASVVVVTDHGADPAPEHFQ